mmetsp:Transcript_35651/g.113278  ORF Transcript_35651/g.113278 Transcript_35651/m.113278 type:complete len:204 (-) Transcript_35651:1229-1840(-)
MHGATRLDATREVAPALPTGHARRRPEDTRQARQEKPSLRGSASSAPLAGLHTRRTRQGVIGRLAAGVGRADRIAAAVFRCLSRLALLDELLLEARRDPEGPAEAARQVDRVRAELERRQAAHDVEWHVRRPAQRLGDVWEAAVQRDGVLRQQLLQERVAVGIHAAPRREPDLLAVAVRVVVEAHLPVAAASVARALVADPHG